MPSQVIRPLATGAYNAWALAAGGSKVAAVDTGDPVAHDDVATYINSPGVNSQSFTLTPIPPAMASVTSFTVGTRLASGAAISACFTFTRLSGVDLNVQTMNTVIGVWTTFGPTAAGRPGGGSWAPNDFLVAGVEMGIGHSDALDTVGCTSLWGILTYVLPGSGFAFLVRGLIPFLIGANLQSADMPGIAAELAKRGTIVTAQEYAQMLRDLKADPHRIYFVPRSKR